MFRLVRALRQQALLAVANLELLPNRLRAAVLKMAGVSVGANVLILKGVRIKAVAGRQVTIGDRVFLNHGVHFDVGDGSSVTIGPDCAIGVGTVLSAVGHAPGPPTRRAGNPTPEPIVIGAGCWLGTRVVVLPGVHIAPGCIIGAGAVVTKDTEPNGAYAGVPARRVRDA